MIIKHDYYENELLSQLMFDTRAAPSERKGEIFASFLVQLIGTNSETSASVPITIDELTGKITSESVTHALRIPRQVNGAGKEYRMLKVNSTEPSGIAAHLVVENENGETIEVPVNIAAGKLEVHRDNGNEEVKAEEVKDNVPVLIITISGHNEHDIETHSLIFTPQPQYLNANTLITAISTEEAGLSTAFPDMNNEAVDLSQIDSTLPSAGVITHSESIDTPYANTELVRTNTVTNQESVPLNIPIKNVYVTKSLDVETVGDPLDGYSIKVPDDSPQSGVFMDRAQVQSSAQLTSFFPRASAPADSFENAVLKKFTGLKNQSETQPNTIPKLFTKNENSDISSNNLSIRYDDAKALNTAKVFISQFAQENNISTTIQLRTLSGNTVFLDVPNEAFSLENPLYALFNKLALTGESLDVILTVQSDQSHQAAQAEKISGKVENDFTTAAYSQRGGKIAFEVFSSMIQGSKGTVNEKLMNSVFAQEPVEIMSHRNENLITPNYRQIKIYIDHEGVQDISKEVLLHNSKDITLSNIAEHTLKDAINEPESVSKTAEKYSSIKEKSEIISVVRENNIKENIPESAPVEAIPSGREGTQSETVHSQSDVVNFKIHGDRAVDEVVESHKQVLRTDMSEIPNISHEKGNAGNVYNPESVVTIDVEHENIRNEKSLYHHNNISKSSVDTHHRTNAYKRISLQNDKVIDENNIKSENNMQFAHISSEEDAVSESLKTGIKGKEAISQGAETVLKSGENEAVSDAGILRPTKIVQSERKVNSSERSNNESPQKVDKSSSISMPARNDSLSKEQIEFDHQVVSEDRNIVKNEAEIHPPQAASEENTKPHQTDKQMLNLSGNTDDSTKIKNRKIHDIHSVRRTVSHRESGETTQKDVSPELVENQDLTETQIEQFVVNSHNDSEGLNNFFKMLPDDLQQDISAFSDTTVLGINNILEKTTAAIRFPDIENPAARDTGQWIMKSIVRHAVFMLQKGQSSATIKLNPPNLGKLKLEIVTETSKITGRIIVENIEVKNFINNSIAELRESLAQNGLKVESFDVQVGHNGGTESWARREDFKHLHLPASMTSTKSRAYTTDESSEIPRYARTVSVHPGIFEVWI